MIDPEILNKWILGVSCFGGCVVLLSLPVIFAIGEIRWERKMKKNHEEYHRRYLEEKYCNE